MDLKGSNMTEQTKKELSAIEMRLENLIQSAINTAISAGFKEVKLIITELFNKDIEHINDHLKRHDKWHNEHFEFDKAIEKEINYLRVELTKEIDEKIKPANDKLATLDLRQTVDETYVSAKDKFKENRNRQSEITWGKVAGIGGIIALVFTAIGYFINAGT
jgi:hypothetical protein